METCRCGDVFDDHDSLGSLMGICQMCWEAYCANTWWNAVNAMTEGEADEPSVSVR